MVSEEGQAYRRWEPLPTQMLPSDASFTANSAERWLQPSGGSSRPEPSRYIATFSVVLMYALMVLLLVFENKYEPVTPPEPVEVPIEIVAEPPPPPPPPPSPAPQPTEQPLDEKPAFDAPRPANDEKVDREAPDKVSQAPPAPPPVKPPGQDAETGKATGSEAEAETPPKESPADPAKEKTVAELAPNGDVKLQAPQPPPTPTETEVPPQLAKEALLTASRWGLLLALAALGLNTSLASIARVGLKPVLAVGLTTAVVFALPAAWLAT